jgi:protein-S-isoprenylcysteine O-methyltransferase Ste14
MTAGHLLFAAFLSLYIFIAIPIEERDLVHVYGQQYIDYRNRVGGLIPRLPARSAPPATAAEM